MKKIKRVLLGVLLSKAQKSVILDSIKFSEHTYRRRNNVDGAVAVKAVLNQLEGSLEDTEKVYTESQVSKIVESVIKEWTNSIESIAKANFKNGYKEGVSVVVKAVKEDLEVLSINSGELDGVEHTFEIFDVNENGLNYILTQKKTVVPEPDVAKEETIPTPVPTDDIIEKARLRAEDDGVDYEDREDHPVYAKEKE